MAKLLLITDFPECTTCKFIESGGVTNLKRVRCIEIFREKDYQRSNYMLCVISDGEDWQVLHPVISDLSCGTMHPRRPEDWDWLAGPSYTEEQRNQSHEIFTRRLRETLGPAYAAIRANLPIQNEPQKSSPRKSAAPVKLAERNEKKEADPDLETRRKIILENFDKFQKAYKARYGKEFRGSDDQAMFFRNDDDLGKILDLIKKAEKRSQLIDLVNFYELYLGNPESADIIVLGKNPGAEGIDTPKTDKNIEDLLVEMELRKECKKKGLFFPLYSLESMKKRPWFPSRLIFGNIKFVGKGKDKKYILPPESDPKEGILSKFIETREDACKYADKICSLDLVPYHTVDFAYGQDLVREFGIDKTLREYIKNAMDHGKVILAPYSTTLRDYWCKMFPDLPWRESYVYTTHVALGQKNAPQNGNSSINNLRHSSKVLEKKPRKADENCEPLFDQLKKLGW